jgi:hypothetical protein
MRAMPSLFHSLLTPLVHLVPLHNDSSSAFNQTLNQTQSTSRVLLLNNACLWKYHPCLLLCLLACHTVQINIGHEIHLTSHLAVHIILGIQQTGFDRPSAPSNITNNLKFEATTPIPKHP